MQNNSGTPFSDPLLDKAMKEQILNDHTNKSSLQRITKSIAENRDVNHQIFPLREQLELNKAVLRSILPKFIRCVDNVNGLGITVHDTWATQITLESLSVKDHKFTAIISYHIQDHFGLDDPDVQNIFFKQFRMFRIWFVLQRWCEYNYKPFITDINVSIEVNGHVQ